VQEEGGVQEEEIHISFEAVDAVEAVEAVDSPESQFSSSLPSCSENIEESRWRPNDDEFDNIASFWDGKQKQKAKSASTIPRLFSK